MRIYTDKTSNSALSKKSLFMKCDYTCTKMSLLLTLSYCCQCFFLNIQVYDAKNGNLYLKCNVKIKLFFHVLVNLWGHMCLYSVLFVKIFSIFLFNAEDFNLKFFNLKKIATKYICMCSAFLFDDATHSGV